MNKPLHHGYAIIKFPPAGRLLVNFFISLRAKKIILFCIFLITFSFVTIFYENSQRHDLLYKKTACKFDSKIIIQSEEILVLIEGP